MTSSQEYQQQILESSLARIDIEVASIAEAREALRQIRGEQKELQQLKRLINLDMKTIRAEYAERLSTAAAGASTIVALLGKRKLASQLRAEEKRRLRMERDRTLHPYTTQKLAIDGMLVRMDAAKDDLQDFIEEMKAQHKAKPSPVKKISNIGARFCPQCGTAVDEHDKFCRQCGEKL